MSPRRFVIGTAVGALFAVCAFASQLTITNSAADHDPHTYAHCTFNTAITITSTSPAGNTDSNNSNTHVICFDPKIAYGATADINFTSTSNPPYSVTVIRWNESPS